MTRLAPVAHLILLCLSCTGLAAQPEWTIYVANDNCPDYTWGLTEEQTRQAFADIVKGHLDEMKRTDDQCPENQNRYNAAVTQEAICFLTEYPERKDELIRRVMEGRLYVSPYLCNSLWGFQSLESTIRTFYPARRLQREWGLPMNTAHHIELPSLPWGTATILAGCGIRNLTVPYLNYDCTFGGLTLPPLFELEGPDGSRIRVCLDKFASEKANYTQGAHLLRRPELIEKEWIPHYAGLGPNYPFRSILAAGTHGDISPTKGTEARGFSESLAECNARLNAKARLVNATYPQFWQAIDRELTRPAAPPLPVVRGSLGHSWDLWPVSLAKYAAQMRRGEREYLSSEALLAVAALGRPETASSTWSDRQRAEWSWVMLSDHAWNGTDQNNKAHNAALRRGWALDWHSRRLALEAAAWSATGWEPDVNQLVVFNGLSFPRSLPMGTKVLDANPHPSVWDGDRQVPSQVVACDGASYLCLAAPEVPGFGFKQLELRSETSRTSVETRLKATPQGLESPFYRLAIDPHTGGIASLIHKPTGRELVAGGEGQTLGQTVFHDGREHVLTEAQSEVLAVGPVVAVLRTRGNLAGIEASTSIVVYADLDQVDLSVTVKKPLSTQKQRLCQLFPIQREGMTLRVATPGAVVRPRPQAEGDLVLGADARRFAVQEFIDVSDNDFGVTIAPRDAFMLRLDLEPVTFEALGNDQNYKEVSRDQNGEKEFSFSYAIHAHAGAYHEADAYVWSRSAAQPLIAMAGRLRDMSRLRIIVDPARAIAACLKLADGPEPEGVILRLQEVGGKSGPLPIDVEGCTKAMQTDLLERDLKPLPIEGGRFQLDLKAHGLGAVRLIP